MLSIRLPTEIDQRLSRLAALTKRPKSFYVREALERHIEDLEDAYIAIERIMDPHARYYSTEEVSKKLGL